VPKRLFIEVHLRVSNEILQNLKKSTYCIRQISFLVSFCIFNLQDFDVIKNEKAKENNIGHKLIKQNNKNFVHSSKSLADALLQMSTRKKKVGKVLVHYSTGSAYNYR
jgi:hypothetical protein